MRTVNVTAKLGKLANLVDGTNTIPLEVKLGDKTLTLNAQQIHPQADAGLIYPLSIQPTGKGHSAGTYAGDVVLIFDGV